MLVIYSHFRCLNGLGGQMVCRIIHFASDRRLQQVEELRSEKQNTEETNTYTKWEDRKVKEEEEVLKQCSHRKNRRTGTCGNTDDVRATDRTWSWFVLSSQSRRPPCARALPSLVPAVWGWCRRGPPWAWAGWQCPPAGSAIAEAAPWTSAPAGRSPCGPGAQS